MRMPWTQPKSAQLELLDAEPILAEPAGGHSDTVLSNPRNPPSRLTHARNSKPSTAADAGQPLLVAVSNLIEDPSNPRTEFPDAEIDELAADIRLRGILQPIVVHPIDAAGHYRIHFGAKRLRAAIRAGLHEVPVVVRDMPADRYAQVAENQKRHGLSPLELARFIRAQVDAGDSNATIARQLGMNLTTVAHHLCLLELPPVLNDALQSGRCTSPRTLHELSKLHADSPGKVQDLLASGAEITRTAVSAIRAARDERAPTELVTALPDKLIAQANAACDRLERALSRIKPPDASTIAASELVALRSRVEGIATGWLQGSDRQTPSQAER